MSYFYKDINKARFMKEHYKIDFWDVTNIVTDKNNISKTERLFYVMDKYYDVFEIRVGDIIEYFDYTITSVGYHHLPGARGVRIVVAGKTKKWGSEDKIIQRGGECFFGPECE